MKGCVNMSDRNFKVQLMTLLHDYKFDKITGFTSKELADAILGVLNAFYDFPSNRKIK